MSYRIISRMGVSSRMWIVIGGDTHTRESHSQVIRVFVRFSILVNGPAIAKKSRYAKIIHHHASSSDIFLLDSYSPETGILVFLKFHWEVDIPETLI